MKDVSVVVGGGTPDTKDPSYFGGEIAWITPADLSHHRAKRISGGKRALTTPGYDNSGAQMLPAGRTVVFSSRAPIGYVAIASQDLCTNQGFKSFVLETGIDSDYVYYYLQFAKPFALKLASGTTFLEISARNAARLPFRLPPTKEQRRVAEQLDELLSDLDAAVHALQRAKARLKVYRASVLKAAVEGDLTAEWRAKHPNVEPASELLKRILAERRRGWEEEQLAKFKAKGPEPVKNWKVKYAEPSAADISSALPQLPRTWSWATVDECSERIQYGTSAKTQSGAEGVAVLRMGNISADGRLLLTDMKYLPDEHPEFPELFLRSGDLLFNRTNSVDLVGKTAVYEGEPAPCSFASYLIRVRLVKAVLPKVLAVALNGGFGRVWIRRVFNQTVGQANVNGTKLSLFAFPLPPLAEQEAIIAAVDAQVTNIDHLEADIDAKLLSAKALRQSILRHAFTGKLVPQDPSDEPASELLKRIAAERETRARNTAATKTPSKQRKAKTA